MQVAANDVELMIQERMKEKAKYIHKLQEFFRASDTSGDGKISASEFQEILSDPEVRTWLQMLDLEVHEAKILFTLLDNGDGLVTYDELCEGALRLKGQARSMDIVCVLHDLRELIYHSRKIESALGRATTGSLNVAQTTKEITSPDHSPKIESALRHATTASLNNMQITTDTTSPDHSCKVESVLGHATTASLNDVQMAEENTSPDWATI